MGKMGQELHELLGKHRYEMWEALKTIRSVLANDGVKVLGEGLAEQYEAGKAFMEAEQVLAKIDSLDLRDRKQLEDLKAMRK